MRTTVGVKSSVSIEPSIVESDKQPNISAQVQIHTQTRTPYNDMLITTKNDKDGL